MTPRNARSRRRDTESLHAYFTRLLLENPSLLDDRSDSKVLARWRTDHPRHVVNSSVTRVLRDTKRSLRARTEVPIPLKKTKPDTSAPLEPLHSPKLTCFVLMPFSSAFTFVYEHGIKPAVQDLAKAGDNQLSIDLGRADEQLAVNVNKVQQIADSIRAHDLVVIDLTEDNPNVLWELGYCQAIGKRVIPIRQRADNLPFNLRGLEVITYDFSVEGMSKLRAAFLHKLGGLLDSVVGARDALRSDPDVNKLLTSIDYGLSRIRADSVLRQLAINELQRLESRIVSLTRGSFDLRKEKPNSEIIRYYSEYLSQLDNDQCSFRTVSFHSFWEEITASGGDWRYLSANVAAAEKGVKIERVFMVREKRSANSPEAALLRKVWRRALQDAGRYRQNIEMRILECHSLEDDVVAYGNFGLLRRGHEQLLFKPVYDGAKMTKTEFSYYDDRTPDADHKREFGAYEAIFQRVWSRSRPLTKRDYE